ncbi:MAG TPA: protein kinase [Polyangia bacterium]|nr:protein kinase [Polyangia bacterium]
MDSRRKQSFFSLTAGQRLGENYRVVEWLGRGWEGEVYKVLERGTGVERAAKIFYPRRNIHGTAIRRYARKLNRLRHVPAIIQYHHRARARLGVMDVQFMVSEYVEGTMLDAFLAGQSGHRFPLFESLHLLRALAWSVAPIHQAREYHGDLHAENIIVRRAGTGFAVKLMDFFDIGQSNHDKIADDVFDLVNLFYKLIGGAARYGACGSEIKQLVCGRRRAAVHRAFRNASDLLAALDNLRWE